MYKTVLFDLDGTLTDSGRGIINSVLFALKKYDIQVEDLSILQNFLGPPLQDSFQKYFHFSDEEIPVVIDTYREYFRSKGMFENEVYKGVPELLEQIKSSGRKLIVATSKPEAFSYTILKHFHLDKYFDFIAGATMDGIRGSKPDIIRYALDTLGITDLSSVEMVGDRMYDIYGAKEIGIDSVGVLYGYGSEEELRNAGATYIAKCPEDIAYIIEGQKVR